VTGWSFNCSLNYCKWNAGIVLYRLCYDIVFYLHIHIYIEGVSRLVDITAGGDFLGLCDQKGSHKRVQFWTVTEL